MTADRGANIKTDRWTDNLTHGSRQKAENRPKVGKKRD